MCQVCTPISTLASSTRWPKPLEPSIADLNFLLTCIHCQHERWKAKSNSSNDNDLNALLSLIRDLCALLTSLDHGRTAW